MDLAALQQLAVSLGLGLLLGLERERHESVIAGIRTFPLIAVFGTVCAQLGVAFGGWTVAAGLLALTAVVISANYAKIQSGDIDPGMTTEIAALLLFGVGAIVVVGSISLAVVIGGVMAVALHFKQPLHRFAAAVGDRDMRAIMQFVLITMVILPVLPDRNMGPLDVWNPFAIWLMVVLIVGISLGGYVAYKILGERAGTLLGGMIGGLISSTATTVSYARRSREKAALAPLASLVILIAACMSLGRVLVEIGAVAPGAFARLAPPLGVLLGACIVTAAGMFVFTRSSGGEMPEQKNPAELSSALVFTALYALILLAVAVAKDNFGPAGLYAVSVISGLTDMDAITLSTAGMVDSGGLEPATAWRAILLAALANFAFKFGVVTVLGGPALARRVGFAFGLVGAVGVGLFFLWP
jgi:uncharacterized membrane protein (DUF4010 family)